MKKYFLLLGLSFILAGCATQQGASLSPTDRAELDVPLYCEGESECNSMWERAMFFVSSNAGYKMQIANDILIETYNPTQYNTKLAMRVTKEPLGNGNYHIVTTAWCNNVFGCTPDAYVMILKAKRYMKQGAET